MRVLEQIGFNVARSPAIAGRLAAHGQDAGPKAVGLGAGLLRSEDGAGIRRSRASAVYAAKPAERFPLSST